MKTISILFVVTLALGLNANSDSKKINPIQSNTFKKSEYSPMVKVKIDLSLSKGYFQRYSLVMPLKKENLAILNGSFQKRRFESKSARQPRFKNMENIDLASIVESNKLYNLPKTIQVKSY